MTSEERKRRLQLQADIMAKIKTWSEERQKKEDAGICVTPGCDVPALKDDSELFFGKDHCGPCAKQVEIEVLEMEQRDDQMGVS